MRPTNTIDTSGTRGTKRLAVVRGRSCRSLLLLAAGGNSRNKRPRPSINISIIDLFVLVNLLLGPLDQGQLQVNEHRQQQQQQRRWRRR